MKLKKNKEPRKIQETKVQLHVVVSRGLKADLTRYSDRTGVSSSKIVEDAIRSAMNSAV